MESAERVALVNKMVGLVNELYFLETCCPQQSCAPKTIQSNHTSSANYGNWVPCGPKTQNVRPPQYVTYHCEIKQPRTSSSSTYRPSATSACTVSQPNNYFSKPKTDMNTTYKTDYINHFPRNKSPSKSASGRTSLEPKPCIMMKCEPNKCLTNPNDVPLITWTPVMEIRKTTNPKNLERQNDDPITQYVYVVPPGCPYKPVWSTKDPMCEQYCGPPPECPALGPPPGYDGGPIELCCPGGKGPPVDRWGQPYECKQTLDGRPVCKPTKDAGPTDWCDAKTAPFRQCDTLEESKRILTRGKVLNNRFKVPDCIDRKNSKRSSSLYKRPIWPKKETCYDGRCAIPDGRCARPGVPGNKRVSKPSVQSRGPSIFCMKI